jgi:hypothetical protein
MFLCQLTATSYFHLAGESHILKDCQHKKYDPKVAIKDVITCANILLPVLLSFTYVFPRFCLTGRDNFVDLEVEGKIILE